MKAKIFILLTLFLLAFSVISDAAPLVYGFLDPSLPDTLSGTTSYFPSSSGQEMIYDGSAYYSATFSFTASTISDSMVFYLQVSDDGSNWHYNPFESYVTTNTITITTATVDTCYTTVSDTSDTSVINYNSTTTTTSTASDSKNVEIMRYTLTSTDRPLYMKVEDYFPYIRVKVEHTASDIFSDEYGIIRRK